MKKIDLDRTIIEATIGKALSEMKADPERTIRKLIDIGKDFANGPFQKDFFHNAQQIMEKEDGAYYRLIKRMVTEVDHQNLKTFGMNVGYNGCTKGAKTIRRREEELQFNIPWALSFVLSSGSSAVTTAEVSHVITQGKELGIYVYLLFLRSNRLEEILQLLDTHDDCAFILFFRPAFLTSHAICELQSRHNVLLSLASDQPETEQAARALREGHFLFAIHTIYSAQDVQSCLEPAHMEQISSYAPFAYFLIAAEGCPIQSIETMGQFVSGIRDAQKYPVLPIDIMHDMLSIDQIISDDGCAVTFSDDGYAGDFFHGARRSDDFSLRKRTLISILKASNPKK